MRLLGGIDRLAGGKPLYGHVVAGIGELGSGCLRPGRLARVSVPSHLHRMLKLGLQLVEGGIMESSEKPRTECFLTDLRVWHALAYVDGHSCALRPV